MKRFIIHGSGWVRPANNIVLDSKTGEPIDISEMLDIDHAFLEPGQAFIITPPDPSIPPMPFRFLNLAMPEPRKFGLLP